MANHTLEGGNVLLNGYRQATGVIFLNPEGKVLLGLGTGSVNRQRGMRGIWKLPQGGITPSECTANGCIDYLAAINREAYEELGVTNLEQYTSFWLKEPTRYHYTNIRSGSSAIGQEVYWLVVLYPFTTLPDLSQSGDVINGREKPEFERLEWFNPRKAVELVTKPRKAAYRRLLKDAGAFRTSAERKANPIPITDRVTMVRTANTSLPKEAHQPQQHITLQRQNLPPALTLLAS